MLLMSIVGMISEIKFKLVICLIAILMVNDARSTRVPQVILENTADQSELNLSLDQSNDMSNENQIAREIGSDVYSRHNPQELAQARIDKRPQVEPAGAGQPQQTVQASQIAISALREDDVEETPVLRHENSGGCGRHGKSCSIREESRLLRIEMVKKNILERLSLEGPPNITGRMLPPNAPPIKAMMRRYGLEEVKQAKLEDYFGEQIDKQEMIGVAEKPNFNARYKPDNWFYFNFTEEERTFDVHSAYIWVYIRPRNSSITFAFIDFCRYLPEPDTLEVFPHRFRRQLIWFHNKTAGFWHKVNLTAQVRHWMRFPSQNYGIKVMSKGITNLIATGRIQKGYKPFLEANLVAGQRRKRRSPNEVERCEREAEENNHCCIYDLEINFEKIGWNWIIYPISYNARHCAGECNLLQTNNMRDSLVRYAEIGGPKHMKNCCVPKELSYLSMLYYDTNANIVYSKIPEMKIQGCTCM
ncbi:unnamed protein product [Clavelina lepadiformis]|uniref:TGF-beta family profile domain-containing protein n=1 Tax=Clavelina lepadiformis TaxID=159417 RepID=A0ABP0GWI9_CLALP